MCTIRVNEGGEIFYKQPNESYQELIMAIRKEKIFVTFTTTEFRGGSRNIETEILHLVPLCNVVEIIND